MILRNHAHKILVGFHCLQPRIHSKTTHSEYSCFPGQLSGFFRLPTFHFVIVLELRYYDTVYKRDGIHYFWSIKNSHEVLYKFKYKNFKVSKLSTFGFYTLCTMLPHHLIKDKLIDLINQTFIWENTQYLACNEGCAFFTSEVNKNYNSWSCQNICDALVYLLDNIFIRFGIIDKLLVFRWELIVLLLLQICFFLFFFFVMKEIS